MPPTRGSLTTPKVGLNPVVADREILQCPLVNLDLGDSQSFLTLSAEAVRYDGRDLRLGPRHAVARCAMHLVVRAVGRTIKVRGISELNAANANDFRDYVIAAMAEPARTIEIDCSQLKLIDSCGLGVLISLHKACGRKGRMRLLNPVPSLQHILELTRMHRIFEIVNSPVALARSSTRTRTRENRSRPPAVRDQAIST
jgi:anti-sigma B factor antagonist